jgi:hypothetical protein
LYQRALSQDIDLNFAAVRPEFSLQLFFMSKVHYTTQNELEMVHISRTPVHWTVSRNILLKHELSHGLENVNENAQIQFIL